MMRRGGAGQGLQRGDGVQERCCCCDVPHVCSATGFVAFAPVRVLAVLVVLAVLSAPRVDLLQRQLGVAACTTMHRSKMTPLPQLTLGTLMQRLKPELALLVSYRPLATREPWKPLMPAFTHTLARIPRLPCLD